MLNTSDNWDLPTLNFRNPDLGSSMSASNVPDSNNTHMITTPLGRVLTSAPPPVPVRPNKNKLPVVNSHFPGYGAYPGPYGYGGFGAYGFGGYRPGYNPYGSGGYYSNYLPENRFIQMAEESSRPILDAVHSVLHTFSSVTMMFESSFHAIYSSYISVVGVAANFAKIKNLFKQVFSGFALIKTVNWIFRRLLHMLGLYSDDDIKESAWSDALKEAKNVGQSGDKMKKKKIWPLLVIMSIVIGGPYLLFKLMSELNPNPMPAIWEPKKSPGHAAIALYDFQAASNQELSFKANDKLMIAPHKYQPRDCPGWLLACNSHRRIGLIPNNYITKHVRPNKGGPPVESTGEKCPHMEKNLQNMPVPEPLPGNTNSNMEMKENEFFQEKEFFADNDTQRIIPRIKITVNDNSKDQITVKDETNND